MCKNSDGIIFRDVHCLMGRLMTNNIQPLGYHPSGTYYRYLENTDLVPYVRISKLYYYIWILSSNIIVPHLDCWDRNLLWRGKRLLNFPSWILEFSTFFNYAENHVQNQKSSWKSYAVFLAIIWLLKIETFTKLAFILLRSRYSLYLLGVSHWHCSKESKYNNIILICAHMARNPYFSGTCNMCLMGDIQTVVKYSC